MRFRCRIGWHDWTNWVECGKVCPVEGEPFLALKRACWACGLVQFKAIKIV